MHTLDVIMSILLALTIIAATIFGDKFLQQSYRTRLIVAALVILVFGGWIISSHVR